MLNREGIQHRMQWVDAMRGFSMLVVVFVHVLTWSGVHSSSSPLVNVLMTFWMPLFFFISGYFSFRKPSSWNRCKLKDVMKRKAQAQIVGAVVFCAIYRYMMNGQISFAYGFGAYWFTIVLFQMYIVYILLSLLSRMIGRDITIPIMVTLSIVLCGTVFIYKFDSQIAEFFRWINLTQYFQFFTLGLICHRYGNKFQRFISGNRNVTLLMGVGGDFKPAVHVFRFVF